MTPVASGQVRCGTMWADGGVRDTDWYLLSVGASGSVSVTLNSEPPGGVIIIRDPAQNCSVAQLQPVALAFSESCAPGVATVEGLTPGEEVYVFVAPATIFGPVFEGFPCGTSSDYRLFISSP
jgi:hypothetical protein